jgi:uncharacterized protein YggE
MSRRSRFYRPLTLAAALGAAVPALTATAQSQQPTPPPAITVVARGEVQVAPDRARVQVGLETKARTANAAAAENNRKQAAIIKALQALGIPAAQIRTINFSVQPEQRWDPKEQRTILDGYRVSNIVSVETDKLDQAGPIIDAGLSNGANRIAGLEFLVKDRAKAEDAALADAVASARRQADVAAKAAGGVVAELLELIVMESGRPEPVPMMAMAKMAGDAAAPTPISEGMSTVSVSVSTRWRFAKQP